MTGTSQELIEAVALHNRLDDYAASGQNLIQLRSIKESPILFQQVAIGVGLATCEIRTITAVSHRDLTLDSNLDYGHDSTEVVMLMETSKAPIGWWGAVPDGDQATKTDNRQAIERALVQSQKTGIEIHAEGLDYYLELDSTNLYITLNEGKFILRGVPGKTRFILGPDSTNANAVAARVLNVVGVDCDIDGITFVPPTTTDIATVSFDDLKNRVAIWLNPNGVDCDWKITNCNVDQGFETGIQVSGDGSAGWMLKIDDCYIYAYSVPVAAANSDDAAANDVLRAIHARRNTAESHNNEGPDWTTRGRCWYIHPHISQDVDDLQLYGSGSGRPQIASYSSGAVKWWSYPPKYIIWRNVKMTKRAGGPSTEGMQTTNLIGVTTIIDSCVFDVDEQAIRVRGDCEIINCSFIGSTKSISAEQSGPLKAHLTAAASATDTTISVTDGSHWTDGQAIIIKLDDGSVLETTVDGTPAANDIDLDDAIPSTASINNWVVHTITQSGSNATTALWFKIIDCTFKNDPTPDAMIVGDTRIRIDVVDCTFDIDTQDSNAGVYQALLAGSVVHFEDCVFNSIGYNQGYAVEQDDGEVYMNGCKFYGDFYGSRLMQITANADVFEMNDCTSWANSSASGAYSFMNGAAPANTVRGKGNRFYGDAKPRMTNQQNLQFAEGTDPTTKASAATVNLDWTAYNVFEITGTTQITTLGINRGDGTTADALVRDCHSGVIGLIFTDASPGGLGTGGNIVTKGGGASAYNQNEIAWLYHFPKSNVFSEV